MPPDAGRELFCHEQRKHIGALTAVLGGIDTLVFTGGIGEHAAPVREETAGASSTSASGSIARETTGNEAIISVPESGCTVRTLRTDEDQMIARHSRAIVAKLQTREAR